MRKFLLVILLCYLCLTLFASDIYKSNELGQKLNLESSIGQEGYFLEVKDNTETLYYDSSVYLTITTISSEDTKTITKHYATGREEVLKYENGLLKVYSNDNTSVVYNYINNRLAFCLVDGSEIFFLRSASDGSLIAIKRASEVDLVGDTYLYQNGSFYNIVSNSLVVTGNYETLDDGSFSFHEGEKSYHYSPLGVLLSITSDSETVTYQYEEDVLSTVTTTQKDGSYSVSSYEKGVLISVKEYSANGEISICTDYSTGKMIRTVYKDGRPVADIYYKDDNITVENIKYR